MAERRVVRHASDDDPFEIGTLGEPGSAVYDAGAVLFDVLSLPGTAGPGPDGRYGTDDDTTGISPESVFTWTIDESGRQTRATQMTLAGALSWLRSLANSDRDQYNYIQRLLVESKYLDPSDVRYGSYTNDIAAAFLQSVIDVYFVNQDEAAGQTTTWFNHIDGLIQGAMDSGTGPGGDGSGGAEPTRTDAFTDPLRVRDAIQTAAKNALGRDLTDDEAAAFAREFGALEQGWNDQRYAAQMAQFQGQSAQVTDAPDPGLAADAFLEREHADEANAQAFGSYMGVLRRMVGLGAEGIGGMV